MTRNEKYRFHHWIFLVSLALVLVVGFQAYIQNRYIMLVKTPHLIDDFEKTVDYNLPLLKKKYGIEYARISSGKIVEMPEIDLPRMNLFTVSLVKNPLVLQNEPKESLLLTRPYVFTRSFSLYVLFPLIFPEKKDGFLIIKKIFL